MQGDLAYNNGSTKLLTDQTGNPVQAVAQYYAYGREQAPGSLAGLPTEYTFTGQRLDNTGLIYMNARYYDPELGQFLSPDTLIADPTNLFDYNRYMYARGKSLRYNDPTGHCLEDACVVEIGAACVLTDVCQEVANLVTEYGSRPGKSLPGMGHKRASGLPVTQLA